MYKHGFEINARSMT